MVRASSNSTSSAQVDGPSGGQAEAPMRLGADAGRTISFITPRRPQSGRRPLFGRQLLSMRGELGAPPVAADDKYQDRAEQGAEQHDVVRALGAEPGLQIGVDHRVGGNDLAHDPTQQGGAGP